VTLADLSTGTGDVMIESIFHVNVNCTDFDRSVEFCSDPDGTVIELIQV